MLDLVNGDAGMSRHLSKALKVLADSPIDAELKKQLLEIRSGNGSLRDLAQSGALTKLGDAVMPTVAAELNSKTLKEMLQLAKAGEAVLERYRNQAPEEVADTSPSEPPAPSPTPNSNARGSGLHDRVIPGTRKPDRDRIVTPDEPDDDDLYFQDRRNGGWLR
ncbi:hypothetical protein ACWZHB_33045 [Nocardia sp. FBN12]|uniref:hypothetical protein n=1 Tax=Nocardia sp. FBN12 TaxID=3419766 RepID=UPI003D09212B